MFANMPLAEFTKHCQIALDQWEINLGYPLDGLDEWLADPDNPSKDSPAKAAMNFIRHLNYEYLKTKLPDFEMEREYKAIPCPKCGGYAAQVRCTPADSHTD